MHFSAWSCFSTQCISAEVREFREKARNTGRGDEGKDEWKDPRNEGIIPSDY